MLNKRSILIVSALLLAPFLLTGCSSDKTSSPVINQEDTVPPMAPTIWESTIDGAIVQLRWAANTETDLAGYNIYEYAPTPQNQNSYVVMNSQPVAATCYEVEGLALGITYYYKVTAVDVSGNESGCSQVIAVTIEAGRQNRNDPSYPELNER
jgi:fibronectin type 3 domain-containing protein